MARTIFSVFDAINYWVLVTKQFENASTTYAHQCALTELNFQFVTRERLLGYLLLSANLSKNIQGISYTKKMNMREVRELVEDYFAYGNATERLGAVLYLYKVGDFRAAAEKVYAEQTYETSKYLRGYQAHSGLSGSLSAIPAPSERGDAMHRSSHVATDPRPRPVSEVSTPTGARTFNSTLSLKDRIESDSPARLLMPHTDHVLPTQKQITWKERQLDTSMADVTDAQVNLTPNLPLRTHMSQNSFVDAVDESTGMISETSVTQPFTPESASQTFTAVNSQRKRRLSSASGSSSDVPLRDSMQTTPAAQPYLQRAAAILANEEIRTTLDAAEDAYESDTSSEPPMKYQMNDENARTLDLGECRFCGGFYIRIQGGGLTKHEVYWCLKNPERRDRVRHSPGHYADHGAKKRRRNLEATPTSIPKRHALGSSGRARSDGSTSKPLVRRSLEEQPVSKSHDTSAWRLESARMMIQAPSTTGQTTNGPIGTFSVCIPRPDSGAAALTKENQVPASVTTTQSRGKAIPVVLSRAKSLNRPLVAAATTRDLVTTPMTTDTGPNLPLTPAMTPAQEFARQLVADKDNSQPTDTSTSAPTQKVVFDSVKESPTQPGNITDLDSSKELPTKKDIKNEAYMRDWIMIEMYLNSTYPPNDILETIYETLDNAKSAPAEPKLLRQFLQHFRRNQENEESRTKIADMTLKYFEVIKASGAQTQIQPKTLSTLMTMCDKFPCSKQHLLRILHAYLELFCPGTGIKIWQFLSRLDDGIAFVKRYCALTEPSI